MSQDATPPGAPVASAELGELGVHLEHPATVDDLHAALAAAPAGPRHPSKPLDYLDGKRHACATCDTLVKSDPVSIFCPTCAVRRCPCGLRTDSMSQTSCTACRGDCGCKRCDAIAASKAASRPHAEAEAVDQTGDMPVAPEEAERILARPYPHLIPIKVRTRCECCPHWARWTDYSGGAWCDTCAPPAPVLAATGTDGAA